ncbi:MAG: hypothetical protein S4CHLAM2_09020 [Chlamydiales bacterium]|nr:hypothetical protein [Chlamydiales bacterium]
MFSVAGAAYQSCVHKEEHASESKARSHYLLIADVISAVVLVGVFTLFASGAIGWHAAAFTLLGAAGLELVLATALRIPCTCASYITRKELANHNAHDDCWVAIHGNVYNITAFLDAHPGGSEVLLDEAGTDVTRLFDQIDHSDDAEAMLAQYLVGQLA